MLKHYSSSLILRRISFETLLTTRRPALFGHASQHLPRETASGQPQIFHWGLAQTAKYPWLLCLRLRVQSSSKMVTAAYYPVNDTSLSVAERAYLQQLEDYAQQQDLDQDLRPNVRALSIAFTVLAAAVVCLRFLARHRQGVPYGADDWLILVSLVLLGGNLVFNMVMIAQGLGLHSGLLTLDELEILNQVSSAFWSSRRYSAFAAFMLTPYPSCYRQWLVLRSSTLLPSICTK